jgi:asparagine synthase (glutamine-hydrolysing)
MCGICGIVKFDANDSVDLGLLEVMTGRISHRGPDDFGYFRDGQAGLGHRRLSIIDLGGGRQPIFNEDGTVVVVFNGEIYNYQEITADLIAHGHVFRTRSDTEAIVHAYEQYGDSCVDLFRGMFAFALWDRTRHRLLLVRDRLGIKPVYYYHGRDSLVFASEIKALLEAPGVPREVDETALSLYLSQRYVPGPRTMFKNIFKLQPGHQMVVEGGHVEVRRYWDIPYAPAGRASSDPAQFEHLLEECVRLRLIAEVPLGVFLSGGLDSSAILATMSRIRKGEPIKTFCVGYESPGGADSDNEFTYAREVAQLFGAEHHEFTLGADNFRDFIPQLVWHLDEPLADPSCIPLYFISRLARQHITVVLSGEGADEVLGGYSIYSKMLALENLRRLPGAGSMAGLFARRFGEGRYHDILRMAALPLEQRYRGVSRGFRPALQARLMGPTGWSHALDEVYGPLFDAVSRASALDRMLYVDSKVWLPDDLLLKADKMTMANGLELRVPFLDHKLVEFASQLPQNMKLHRGTGKVLLRRIMKNSLPGSVLHRAKKGFPVPTMSWLRGPLKEFTRETLLGSGSACRNYFDPQVLREIVDHHEAGGDRQQEIWTLLVFEHWHRAFVQAPQRAEPMSTFAQAGEPH